MVRFCATGPFSSYWIESLAGKFQAIEKAARVRLALLDAATSLRDLNLPGLHLDALREIAKDSTAFGSTISS